MFLLGFGFGAGVIGATVDLVEISKRLGKPVSPAGAMYYCERVNPVHHPQFAHWFVQNGMACLNNVVR